MAALRGGGGAVRGFLCPAASSGRWRQLQTRRAWTDVRAKVQIDLKGPAFTFQIELHNKLIRKNKKEPGTEAAGAVPGRTARRSAEAPHQLCPSERCAPTARPKHHQHRPCAGGARPKPRYLPAETTSLHIYWLKPPCSEAKHQEQLLVSVPGTAEPPVFSQCSDSPLEHFWLISIPYRSHPVTHIFTLNSCKANSSDTFFHP